MKEKLAPCLFVIFLAGCAKDGCRIFSSAETSFCIPHENVLGSLWFLGKTSANEIGFRMGEVADATRITVTLTRRDYLCKIDGSESRERFCRRSAPSEKFDWRVHNVVRRYLNERKSAWTYEAEEDELPLAHCSSIPDQPLVGRCIADGEYKDVVYSAIFLDTRAGGVRQVLTDIEAQIRQWEVKAD